MCTFNITKLVEHPSRWNIPQHKVFISENCLGKFPLMEERTSEIQYILLCYTIWAILLHVATGCHGLDPFASHRVVTGRILLHLTQGRRGLDTFASHRVVTGYTSLRVVAGWILLLRTGLSRVGSFFPRTGLSRVEYFCTSLSVIKGDILSHLAVGFHLHLTPGRHG
jgi:hypothetical protein